MVDVVIRDYYWLVKRTGVDVWVKSHSVCDHKPNWGHSIDLRLVKIFRTATHE